MIKRNADNKFISVGLPIISDAGRIVSASSHSNFASDLVGFPDSETSVNDLMRVGDVTYVSPYKYVDADQSLFHDDGRLLQRSRNAYVHGNTSIGVTSHLLVDKSDIDNINKILENMQSKILISHLPKPINVENEETGALSIPVSVFGLVIFSVFATLIAMNSVLGVYLIHPVLGLIGAVGGGVYLLMGIAERRSRKRPNG